jgi:hypothetical protein
MSQHGTSLSLVCVSSVRVVCAIWGRTSGSGGGAQYKGRSIGRQWAVRSAVATAAAARSSSNHGATAEGVREKQVADPTMKAANKGYLDG